MQGAQFASNFLHSKSKHNMATTVICLSIQVVNLNDTAKSEENTFALRENMYIDNGHT
jgi:hypothetical protein